MVPTRRTAVLLRPRFWIAPYVALWFVVGFLPSLPTDLDVFFWPSAKVALAGHPLLVYSAGGQDAYPNANGPVTLLPLTLVGLLVRVFGWLDALPQRRAVAFAAFSIFLILMAREAVIAIERLRGEPLQGFPRLLAFAVLTLSPPVWQSIAGYGHIEQPIEVWLVLLSVRCIERGAMARAGAAFALAVLTRTSAGLLAIPLGLAGWRAGPGKIVRMFLVTIATGLAGLLPFYLADRADVVHSLITFRGGLQVGAGSIWNLTRGSSMETVIQHWDIAVVAMAVVAVNLWLATRPGGFDESRLFAGMTLTATSFALLTKTVWPYYFFEVLVYGTVWTAGRWKRAHGIVRLAFFPLAISIFGLVAEIGSAPYQADNIVRIESVGMFAMLTLTAAWILRLASDRDRADKGSRSFAGNSVG